MQCNGRTQIFTNVDVTSKNVVEVLDKVRITHDKNAREIEYLWNYYKGIQPVLYRTKEVNPKICNKIVVNRAREIISFKDGYLIGNPVQYVTRSEDASNIDEVNALNAYMQLAKKASEDMLLVNWLHVCGTAYRAVFPSKDPDFPIQLYTLDPRTTFIVYKNDIACTPQMAVTFTKDDTGAEITYTCYTRTEQFVVTGSEVRDVIEYISPTLPIIEYPANPERMGAFEEVLGLLDAINLTESNRLDGVEQFIQSLMVFTNVTLDEQEFTRLLSLGAISIPSNEGQKADVKYLTAELNQSQTQVLVEDMYNAVLTICGIPNRNGSGSTSDTGTAVIMRDGWEAAEGKTKKTELMFDSSDQETLKRVLHLLKINNGLNLSLKDIDIRFTRHNYENLTVKVNALDILLKNDYVAPADAWQISGLVIDPEATYLRGLQHFNSSEAQTQLNDSSEAD